MPSASACAARRTGGSEWPGGDRVPWSPAPGKYLVAVCVAGGLATRLDCFERTILAAAALNRTLVIPHEDLRPDRGGPYDYRLAFDIAHARFCTGNGTILSLAEFQEQQKPPPPKDGPKKLQIGRLKCWLPGCNFKGFVHRNSVPTNLTFEDIKPRSLLLPPQEAAGETPLPPALPFARFLQLFTLPDDIISLGDISGTSFSDSEMTLARLVHVRSDGSSDKCHLVIKPHRAVLKAARGFVREYVGNPYAALHFHRGGKAASSWNIYEDALSGDDASRHPLQQVAECVIAKLERLGIQMLFLATDADEQEVALLQTMLTTMGMAGKIVTAVRLPPLTHVMWAAELVASGNDGSALAAALVEQLVAAMATVFVAHDPPAVSRHVARLREALLVDTCRDTVLCDAARAAEPEPKALVHLADR